jgi:hypothetical protein
MLSSRSQHTSGGPWWPVVALAAFTTLLEGVPRVRIPHVGKDKALWDPANLGVNPNSSPEGYVTSLNLLFPPNCVSPGDDDRDLNRGPGSGPGETAIMGTWAWLGPGWGVGTQDGFGSPVLLCGLGQITTLL